MRYFKITATLILSVALASAASANEIYKWTDEDGNVHYTDKPVDQTSERLDIASSSTNNEAVRAQTQARLDRQSEAAEAAANAPKGPTAEELRAEARERSDKCATYQARLTKFTQSRRLYREDEDGERVYLDDADTQKTRDKTEDQVREYCN
jgi:predicted RNA polymerase sigma factor